MMGRPSGKKKAGHSPEGHSASSSEIELGRLFHALGDPTRRAILDMLSERPLSVSRLAEPLGITVTAVAQHLQLLEESGLARTEKVGRVRTCRIEPTGFTILEKWIRAHRTTWERKFDRLVEILSEPAEPDRAE